MGGVRPIDLMLKETNPQHLTLELDTFWASIAGQDPVKMLETHKGRVPLVHLKDLKKGVATGSLAGHTELTNDVALGTGQVNWPALLRAAQKVGVKYYFIEDESPTVVEQIPHSLRFLERLKY